MMKKNQGILIIKINRVIILILFFSLSGCAAINSKNSEDLWFGPDKVKHFAASAAIGASAAAILKNNGHSDCDAATAGIGFSLAIGAGKEYRDKYIKKKYWSWKDMFWNLVGGTVGSHMASGCY